MDNLLLGLTLGLASGLSPGPLTALILRVSLEKGFSAGVRVAVAPLVTDALMITAGLLASSRLSEEAFRWVAVAGGAVVIVIGVLTLRSTPPSAEDLDGPSDSGRSELLQGVLVNLLNPHAWIFWFTVGAPIVSRSWETDRPAAVAFLAVFLLLLVASKVAFAAFAARSRAWLRGKTYLWTLRILGLALVLFGLRMIWGAA